MLFLLAWLMVLVSPLTMYAASRPGLDVVMELEPGVGLERADLVSVTREMTEIWAPHVDLHVSLSDGRPRAQGMHTVRMLLSTRTLASRESGGLGWIEFIDGVPQSTITLSVTSLRHLIAVGKWGDRSMNTFTPRIATLALRHGLARAAAHEIGHYLLRSTAHARTGLMRAHFTVDDVMDERAGAMRLEPAQVSRLATDTLLIARQESPQAVHDEFVGSR